MAARRQPGSVNGNRMITASDGIYDRHQEYPTGSTNTRTFRYTRKTLGVYLRPLPEFAAGVTAAGVDRVVCSTEALFSAIAFTVVAPFFTQSASVAAFPTAPFATSCFTSSFIA